MREVIKAGLLQLAETVADIPEAELISVSVDDEGPRVHLTWRFFQRWFGGRKVCLVNGHVSIVVADVCYTAIMERQNGSGLIVCPALEVEA